MMNKEQLAKLAKNIFRGSDRVKNPLLLHPNREWTIGLIIGIGLFVAVAVWSVVSYTEYRHISIEDAVEEEVVIYRESTVEMALEQLRKRTSTYEQHLKVTSDNEVEEPVVGVVEDEVTTEVLEEEMPREEAVSVIEGPVEEGESFEEVIDEVIDVATTTEVLLEG